MADHDRVIRLLEKAEATNTLSQSELAVLLASSESDALILAAADRVRKKFVGDEVHLRGLIEFTNRCGRNCLYCGLRRDNDALPRYRLELEQIVAFAEKAVSYGYRTVVLQSGEGKFYKLEEMQEILRAIKALDVAITLSVGEKTREEYEAYREAGADRYLMRIETTDARLYEIMSPGMRYANRVRCLRDLKELGYELGTGCLVGLPGQTIDSLANDILFFRDIGADMIGIGPFIPNPQTPLGQSSVGSLTLALKVMALTRLILPDVNVPATTAMETLDPLGRVRALRGGANVVMPNVTEGDYRKLYALYPGKACVGDTPSHCAGCMTSKITAIGRTVSKGYGYRAGSVRT